MSDPVQDRCLSNKPRSAPVHVRTGLALLAILAVAALLSTWAIGYVGLASYYAAAAKSMAASAHALAFGALDPAASITLDKLSGFLLPQALAIRLFGFHAWALAIPQVLEGLVTVVAGFVIGRRWRGDRTGLALAWLLTTTPVLAAMFGRPMEDGMLTMCQVLAFAALQRFLHDERQRWLIVSAVWIAIGFQAKMMQSWLILPALVGAVLVAGTVRVRIGLARVLSAAVVCVVLSIVWMTVIQLVPASTRPFIDGTTNDNIFSMVFGYNGFDRLLPGIVPGAVPQLAVVHSFDGGTRTAEAAGSVLKLVLPQFTSQVGWLYPLVLVGIAVATADVVRWARTEHRSAHHRVEVATTVGLALWLLVPTAVLSLASVPHATYFGAIALPLAAFAVNGSTWAIRRFRAGSGRTAVPLLVLVQAVWAGVIVANVPQLRVFALTLVLLGLVGAVSLAGVKGADAARAIRIGSVSSMLAVLMGPLLWSSFVLGAGGGGSATDGFAGPRIGADGQTPLVVLGDSRGLIHLHLPFGVPPDAALSIEDNRLLRYVDRRNRTGAIPFASDNVSIVVAVILATPTSPLLLGGYSGHAPDPGVSRFAATIAARRLRFVLLDPAGPAQETRSATVRTEASWVRAHCRIVLSGRFRSGSSQRQTLYDCSGSTPRSSRGAGPIARTTVLHHDEAEANLGTHARTGRQRPHRGCVLRAFEHSSTVG